MKIIKQTKLLLSLLTLVSVQVSAWSLPWSKTESTSKAEKPNEMSCLKDNVLFKRYSVPMSGMDYVGMKYLPWYGMGLFTDYVGNKIPVSNKVLNNIIAPQSIKTLTEYLSIALLYYAIYRGYRAYKDLKDYDQRY